VLWPVSDRARHIFQPDLRERLPAALRLVAELGERGTGLEYLETLLRYISSAAVTLTEADLREVVEEVLAQEGGRLMSTIAEKWVEQGMQRGMRQGMQQGVEQGRREGLLAGIELGLKLKFGTEGLRLLPELYRIEDVGLLRAVHEGIETASTPAELRRIYRPAGYQGEG
jgi:hypothetical protein